MNRSQPSDQGTIFLSVNQPKITPRGEGTSKYEIKRSYEKLRTIVL